MNTIENNSWAIIACLLLLYAIGFGVFYPVMPTISDEAYYLLQAKEFSEGRTASLVDDPLTGRQERKVAGHYPIGTALFIAPFYWLLGLNGAYLFPPAILILTVLITARWLSEEGYSPLFALFVLGYPSTLVMGRIPMSGLPSAFLVGVGYLLFWRGQDGNRGYWFLSGFTAGASLIFRELNPILFVPLFLGAVIRREKNYGYIILGGILGVSLRFLSSYIVYGDLFYVRSRQKTFETFRLDGTILANLVIYPIDLLLFIPGGILWSLSYKGERRFELIATVILFVSVIMVHETSARYTSPTKALLNHSRLLIPLLPLLVFQMAEAVPRFWSYSRLRLRIGRRSAFSFGRILVCLWLCCLALGSFGVHWVSANYTSDKVRMRDVIYETVPEGSVILTNRRSTVKLISPLFGHHVIGEIRSVSEAAVKRILGRYGELFIVVHERFDSEFWKQKNLENERIVAGIEPMPVQLLDETFSDEDRLLIWRVRAQDGVGE